MASVHHLEVALRAWEDFWFVLKTANQISKARGQSPVCPNECAVIHAPDFRKKVLAGRSGVISYNDFLPPVSFEENMGMFFGQLPVCIGEWCRNSRRVYHLDKEIQNILNVTSLQGVTWKDVVFPFPTYAVSLGDPITDNEGNTFDFLTVSNYFVKVTDEENKVLPRIEVRLFSTTGGLYQPLTEANRQNIKTRMRNKEYDHVAKLLTRHNRYVKMISPVFLGYMFCELGESLENEVLSTEFASQVEEGGDIKTALPMRNEVMRIVVGMCLYLKTLPSGSPHQGEWKKAPPKSAIPDSKSITNEAEVCTVSSCYTLTREEKVALGLEEPRDEHERGELRCHFREGHWRRPPGLGNDPTAKKTVHVRPCIVRRDRLPPDALPGGTEKVFQ